MILRLGSSRQAITYLFINIRREILIYKGKVQSDKNFHKLLGLLTTYSTLESLIVSVTLLTSHQMPTFVNITDHPCFAEFTHQFSFDSGWKIHIFLKISELTLTDTLASCFVAIPYAFKGFVKEKISQRKHSKADYYFFESCIVNFIVPERSNDSNSFLLRFQCIYDKLWL